MDILIIHFTLLRLNCEIPALATNSAVSPIESEATIILIFPLLLTYSLYNATNNLAIVVLEILPITSYF